MSKLLYEGELYRNGLLTAITVIEHERDTIEVTLKSQLPDDTGDFLIDNKYQMFFTSREFEEFFVPFLYNVKERFNHDAT